jgi:hypothetical protein
VLLLVALWPRQLTPRLLVVLAAGGLLPFATRPADIVVKQYQSWAVHLTESSTKRWPGFRDSWTIVAVARHLLNGGEGLPDLKAPLDELAYRVVQMLAGLALFLWIMKRKRDIDAPGVVLLALAGGACWFLLLGPASEPPTYVFLAPFLAWGLVERRHWPGSRLIEAAGVLLLVLGWGELTRPWWHQAPWLILILPAGVILYLLWLIRGHSLPSSGHPVPAGEALAGQYRAAPPYACRRSFASPA